MKILCYKIWSWLYMSYLGCCLVSNLMMMYGFCGNAGLSGCFGKWLYRQSMGEDRNENRGLFLCLVQYRTRGKCPSFHCKDFFTYFWTVGSRFHLSSTENFSLFPLRAITCQKPGVSEAGITQSEGWVCHVPNCIEMHLEVWIEGENVTDWGIGELVLEVNAHAYLSEH